MDRRLLVGACVGLLFASGPASAEFSASLGMEYFRWKEATTPAVTETGPMLALGLAYTQEKDDGLLFAYRGRAYFGDVNYSGTGLFTGTPISGTTRYTGMSNEGQLRWRAQIPDRPEYYFDYVMALGWDTWERKLTSVQKEDYDVAFVRLGGEVALKEGEGWIFGLGVKYPFYTREDAHMTDIGFDRNPVLKPGHSASLYGNLSYRLNEKLRLTAYYDGYEFRQSRSEAVNGPLGPGTVFQPASTMSVIGLKLEYRLR
jgi:hypothetical protein